MILQVEDAKRNIRSVDYVACCLALPILQYIVSVVDVILALVSVVKEFQLYCPLHPSIFPPLCLQLLAQLELILHDPSLYIHPFSMYISQIMCMLLLHTLRILILLLYGTVLITVRC
jgi:hypothetical protein